jgi:hypothetical protein
VKRREKYIRQRSHSFSDRENSHLRDDPYHDSHETHPDALASEENSGMALGLANRPISLSNVSSVGKVGGVSNRIFFNSELSEKELSNVQANMGSGGGLSPVYFLNSPPPGLTPNRYPHRSFAFNNANKQSIIMKDAPASQIFNNRDVPQSQIIERSTFDMDRRHSRSREDIEKALSTPSKGGLQAGADKDKSGSEKKKPIILEESKERYTGKLKFFDENKNYGFIIME